MKSPFMRFWLCVSHSLGVLGAHKFSSLQSSPHLGIKPPNPGNNQYLDPAWYHLWRSMFPKMFFGDNFLQPCHPILITSSKERVSKDVSATATLRRPRQAAFPRRRAIAEVEENLLESIGHAEAGVGKVVGCLYFFDWNMTGLLFSKAPHRIKGFFIEANNFSFISCFYLGVG